MSKNTNLSGFRKIDIDAFDPENYQDDEPSNQQGDDRGPNETEVINLLNTKRSIDALNVVLNSAPLNTKDQKIKDSTFQLVLRVLRTIQNVNEIDLAVKSLSQDSVDILMKYIYKGFEREPKDSANLLNWHEKLYAVGGNGCVVRVLSDGKRV